MKSRVGQLFISKKWNVKKQVWRERSRRSDETRCQCHCNQGRPLLSVMILISHLCSSPVVTSTEKKNWRRPKAIGKFRVSLCWNSRAATGEVLSLVRQLLSESFSGSPSSSSDGVFFLNHFPLKQINRITLVSSFLYKKIIQITHKWINTNSARCFHKTVICVLNRSILCT